jgi:YVTN family beta-propeller protein
MTASKTVKWVAAALVVVVAAALGYVRYVRIPTNVAYVSEQAGGISVIDLRTMKVIRRVHPNNVAPRGIDITHDGKYVVVADKDTADASVFDTRVMRLVKRFHIGDNPEFVKLNPRGDELFTSYEARSTGGLPTSGGDDSKLGEPHSHVAKYHVPDWTQELDFEAGTETEGLEFSRDGKYLMVANEAQSTISIYDAQAGTLVRTIDLKPYGQRPRGVKVSPDGSGYAVTMEFSGTLVKMDSNFNVTNTVRTAAMPYGLAFDREGKRIFVSAATARKMQVFAAGSLQLIAETPTGQRCWHFTFTPDDSKILLACGRSNNVVVIDASSYKVIQTIEGFKLPWGIITYPRSFGSLGLP